MSEKFTLRLNDRFWIGCFIAMARGEEYTISSDSNGTIIVKIPKEDRETYFHTKEDKALLLEWIANL